MEDNNQGKINEGIRNLLQSNNEEDILLGTELLLREHPEFGIYDDVDKAYNVIVDKAYNVIIPYKLFRLINRYWDNSIDVSSLLMKMNQIIQNNTINLKNRNHE